MSKNNKRRNNTKGKGPREKFTAEMRMNNNRTLTERRYNDLLHYLDPSTEEISAAKYMHLLVDPSSAELVDVPLTAGGFYPESTVVRLESQKVINFTDIPNLDATGVPTTQQPTTKCINFYGPQSPQDASIYPGLGLNVDSAQNSEQNTQLWQYNNERSQGRVPQICSLPSTAISPPVKHMPVMFGVRAAASNMSDLEAHTGGYFSGPGIGAEPSTLSYTQYGLQASRAYYSQMPDPGIILEDGTARVIAIEHCIRPVTNQFNSEGTITFVKTVTGMTESLAGKTQEEAYALQGADRKTYSLANWDHQAQVKLHFFPTNPMNLNVSRTDYTRVPRQTAVDTPWKPFENQRGPRPDSFGVPWACAYITCPAPDQRPWEIEIVSTYIVAFMNDRSSFSRPTHPISYGMELPQTLALARPTIMERPRDAPAHNGAAIAQTILQKANPVKAKQHVSFLSKIGGALGKAARFILPKVADLALTAVTDGVIPPGVASMAADALLPSSSSNEAYHPMTGVPERESVLALPAPSRAFLLDAEEGETVDLKRIRLAAKFPDGKIAPPLTDKPTTAYKIDSKEVVHPDNTEAMPSCTCQKEGPNCALHRSVLSKSTKTYRY